MSITKQIPIKPRERRQVANLGRLITELAELERLLTTDESQKLHDAADQVEWLAGERRIWTSSGS
tara:strand:- start:58 stop:252 length:195 start_codon:yes stop_codon:yes gene_type:complete